MVIYSDAESDIFKHKSEFKTFLKQQWVNADESIIQSTENQLATILIIE